ncbi:hypothetical protein M670_04180 [Schinkia azotoformans MEV2011]|uniref:DUF4083 domain-containing protein n=1 Tax=Schinkia azotoformans MEV2011 TaxID=1348973 RepID=A0A072NID8_SCHAZ|nr:hypothetical protein [Schinkia azotoformans]KEF36618.1 hypothetical protein M670_04180 [Schinkia azotoformans MEV2011]MEC1695583.1 hypothetical protein [Schinkia azotoformans]MEC1714240.1 hypothetical protein [Schinkia azotoformans]MEC1723978.1 hypothetical protein [Schinkia azotoformans]MEC1740770.1 hypothetical protein [Schinkia azotoformans]
MLQFLLLEAGSGINVGDIIFQLMSFLILLGIPVVLIFIFSKARRKRNNRLDRIEEKLDQLLAEKEPKNKGE